MKSRLIPGIALILLMVGSATVALLRRSDPPTREAEVGPPLLDPNEAIAYVCPIHPDYTSASAGECPRDGLTLVQANPYDVRDYEMEFGTDPEVVRAGETVRLSFRIFHPGVISHEHDPTEGLSFSRA